MPDAFHKVTLIVDGEPVESSDEELEVGDINDDMTKVAAQVAYWGAVWAAAEEEKLCADAAYRQWRAEFSLKILSSDSKLAEWKIKARVESDKTFLKLKAALAKAERNVLSAKTRHESFKVKAATLQSRGAMDRAGLSSIVHTPKEPREHRPTTEERERRKSAMRSSNQKKSGKKPKTD